MQIDELHLDRSSASAPASIRRGRDSPDPRELIRSDLYRYAGDTSLPALLKQYLVHRGFRYCVWLRLKQSRSAPVRTLAWLVHRLLSNRYGVSIHTPSIGYGLYIGHAVGIVINPTTVIGDNCNIGQFTTIGSNHGRAAEIGNNVYIGPGVCVVEHVRIGDNSTIGAGAVVVKDVPADATVAGNPARIVSVRSPGRYVANRWPM